MLKKVLVKVGLMLPMHHLSSDVREINLKIIKFSQMKFLATEQSFVEVTPFQNCSYLSNRF